MKRMRSIDIIRGAIMLLMAIDHVRLYGGLPAGGHDPGLYFTRWITHFCAPGFTFLAGTSIFFQALKWKDLNKLSGFLLTRGFLLVILEITVIRFFWAFKINYSEFFLAGIIWMLGWCMILMAALVRIRPLFVGIAGVLIIIFQNLFQYVPQIFHQPFQTSFGKFWDFIYPTAIQLPENIAVLYVIVPWIGVMAAGYAFGLIMQMDAKKRHRICLVTGLTFIVLFVILGSAFIYRNSGDKNDLPFVLQLLNQRKYPASALFLLMTLGPLIGLVPYAEKGKGRLADVLTIFGKAPMFYYLAHVILIHLTALLVNFLRTGNMQQDWYTIAPFNTQQPEGLRWTLPQLYLVWVLDLIILYRVCKWYVSLKQFRPRIWMKFI